MKGDSSPHFLTPSRPGFVDLSPLSPPLQGDTAATASIASSPPHSPSQRRVYWSDEDDPSSAFKSFKKRKAESKQAEARRTRKAKADVKTATNSVVGRKAPAPTPKKRRRHYDDPSSSDSDDDAIENALPAFIKARRKKFDRGRKEKGQEGLKLPPLYEGIMDDAVAGGAVKPVLPHLQPVAEDKDVELRFSAGVIPATIAKWLREYQVQGAEFLHELFVLQRGGILGDDMGLGKTIQVIAFLTAAFGKTGDDRDARRMRLVRRFDGIWYPVILIVCPSTLMANWAAELHRWGWWEVGIYHGATRSEVLGAARKGMVEIVITTYHTYRNDADLLNLVAWDAVIADECHIIRGRTAEVTKAMNDINALCRIGLTGTAIQNNYEELWTLLNWTNPGRFGPMSVWKASISEPLKQGQSHDATQAQLAIARSTARKLVQNLLPQFFLRRMKTLIADQLPKKTDKVVFCPLTEPQSEAYANLVDGEVIEAIRRYTEDCECGSGKQRGWCCHQRVGQDVKWQHMVFPALNTLQKLSNHFAMLIPSGNDPKEKQEKNVEWLQAACPDDWRKFWDTRDSIMNFANQEYCGKWKVLKKLLKFWHSDTAAANKVLVFSHSVKLLKMLHLLFQSTTSYNVSFLDGKMPLEERTAAVHEFNSRPEQFVFLISTKAGGIGLNITSANRVIVFDPNWNPSYDLQAQDRAYRIGQTRDVEVYRLVSQGTVEEIVYARQIYKQQQANIAYSASEERRYFKGVQGTADKRGEIFGLANMFTYQGENLVLRDIVNKTNVAESRAGVSVIPLGTRSQDNADDEDEDEDDWLDSRKDTKPDAAMTRVAALITGEATTPDARPTATKPPHATAAEPGRRKRDAVQAILAQVGVEYTHENSEVIGSSKVEARLSRMAEHGKGKEQVFGSSSSSSAGSGPGSGSGVGGRRRRHGRREMIGHDGQGRDEGEEGEQVQVHDEDEDGDEEARAVKYRYKPPESVAKRQFVTMAASAGYEDVTEFALVVEGWTQGQRREFLDGFYEQRRRSLLLAGSSSRV